LALAVLTSAQAAAGEDPVAFSDLEIRRIRTLSPLPPPPRDTTNRYADSEAAARLGHHLFFDPRLSRNGRAACVTCHDPRHNWTDGGAAGVVTEKLSRQTPSLWNVAYSRWFFWDGRSDSLWSQSLQPIEHPDELGGDRVALVRLVSSDGTLRALYRKACGELPAADRVAALPASAKPGSPEWGRLTDEQQRLVNQVFANCGKAIAAYERLIISSHSPFDEFVDGLVSQNPSKRQAISVPAQRGLRLFIGKANCRSCHHGPNFTDSEFHSLMLPDRQSSFATDPGRFAGVPLLLSDPFNSRGPYSDDPKANAFIGHLERQPHTWSQFKTPSLRNVAKTSPYMHQGQFRTLEDVVTYYSTLRGSFRPDHHHEQILVPLNLSSLEIADLVAFLETLTDESFLHSPWAAVPTTLIPP
jgi:cytochrome c peroxidase